MDGLVLGSASTGEHNHQLDAVWSYKEFRTWCRMAAVSLHWNQVARYVCAGKRATPFFPDMCSNCSRPMQTMPAYTKQSEHTHGLWVHSRRCAKCRVLESTAWHLNESDRVRLSVGVEIEPAVQLVTVFLETVQLNEQRRRVYALVVTAAVEDTDDRVIVSTSAMLKSIVPYDSAKPRGFVLQPEWPSISWPTVYSLLEIDYERERMFYHTSNSLLMPQTDAMRALATSNGDAAEYFEVLDLNPVTTTCRSYLVRPGTTHYQWFS